MSEQFGEQIETFGLSMNQNNVLKVLDYHGIDTEDFLQHFGDKDSYSTVAVFTWLGY